MPKAFCLGGLQHIGRKGLYERCGEESLSKVAGKSLIEE